MFWGRKYLTRMTSRLVLLPRGLLGPCYYGTTQSPLCQPALPPPAAPGRVGSRRSISKEDMTAASHSSSTSSHGCSCSCKGGKCWPCCSLNCWGWPGMGPRDSFYRSKANRNVLTTQAPWQAAPWLQQAALASACVLPWASWSLGLCC